MKSKDQVLVDADSGELFELRAWPKLRRRTISMLYGPNWTAVRCAAMVELARGRDLRGADYRVLLFLLSEMAPGNHIALRPIDVARAMGLRPSNVGRSLGRLKERGLLIDRVPFGWRLHPEFGWRGDPTGQVAKRKDGSLVLV